MIPNQLIPSSFELNKESNKRELIGFEVNNTQLNVFEYLNTNLTITSDTAKNVERLISQYIHPALKTAPFAKLKWDK